MKEELQDYDGGNIINFFYESTDFELTDPTKYIKWLIQIAIKNHKKINSINYIYCDDNHLHSINMDYLNHDTLTDIITFPYTYEPIESDIYISIDRVTENALKYNVTMLEELHRVMAHGLLHLIGFNDKSEEEKQEMRRQESVCMGLLNLD